VPYRGDDPLQFVISLNLRRRHLDESQRAMVAARIANLQDEQRKSGSPIGEAVTQGEAADLLNVGKRSVERARTVLEHGQPELVTAVERGEVVTTGAWRRCANLLCPKQLPVSEPGYARRVVPRQGSFER
jgi:hypothetical protein